MVVGFVLKGSQKYLLLSLEFLLQDLRREFHMRNPLQEFLLTAAEFGGGAQTQLLRHLNVSFDGDYAKRQIHQREFTQTARGKSPPTYSLCHVLFVLLPVGLVPFLLPLLV